MSARASAVTPQSFTTFGELLRYLRERAELSQRELALQVGYHYSYMSRIEKSERIPDSATLMARFVPALYLDDQPEWTARLLKLAETYQERTPSSTALPTPVAPPTALPIFDLSASNLPTVLTPLLGRDKEVTALASLLARDDVRLVTIVGPPGVGKTRLVTHIAAQLAGSFADGAAFVDLTQVTEPKDFLTTVVEALDVYETSEIPLMVHLVNALRQKNMLLVIDNFEHVIDASPQVLQLLSKVPHVKALITSREALRVSGENEFTINPLPVPPNAKEWQAEDPLTFAAIHLFSQRAQAVQPEFQLTPENIDAVIDICRRLDGLPLAIELAAARVKMLTPQAMLAQFDRRLDWLARRARDSQAWHQTLRSAIEWSYNLLSESERVLMRRLSVFSGGWISQSAEAICADAESSGSGVLLRREEILDLLIQLADKSLIVAELAETETRYHLLETIREFAREKLEQAGEQIDIQNRHLAFYCTFAKEAEVRIEGADQVLWANRCEAEHNNIRAALEWSVKDNAKYDKGLQLAASISLFWIFHSHFIEGLERINVFLSRINDISDKLLRAKLLYRSARLLYWRSEYLRALDLCEQSVALCREIDEQRQLAVALYYQGEILVYLNDLTSARNALEESVAMCWQVNAPVQLSASLASLGAVLHKQGDHAAAHAMLEESLGIATRISVQWSIVFASRTLGNMFRLEGKFAEAQSHFERCVEIANMMGDRINMGIALSNLSNVTNMQEDYTRSGRYAAQSLRIFRAVGDELEIPFPLRMMAYAAMHSGDLTRSRILIRESLVANHGLEHIPGQLACVVASAKCVLAEKDTKKAITLGALIETRMKIDGVRLMEPDRKALQEVLAQGKKKLGKAAYESAYQEGQSLELENVIMQLMTE